MARIINVEKSQYINKSIEIYASNKVSQYSKYLDKTPLFVTYLHVNQAQSRNDVGTGGVQSDVGENSPVRFNQINNLPMYNFPELKPSTEYGENGYDIEMDLSDLVLLPNTIKPAVGDYIIVQLPDTIEFSFRVNSFEYNTIQSNDFYQLSADLKYTGKDLIDKFKSQIVEEYETIFENIGTDNKCFLLKQDVEKVKNIGKLFLELREHYKANFFDKETGTFTCKYNPVVKDDDYWFYDKYVEKFIMESEIYYTDNDEKSVILTCADIEPPEMNRLYMQTMHYAVLNRNTNFLSDHPYFYQIDIQKRFSPFKIYQIKCKGVNLLLTDKDLNRGHSDAIDSGLVFEYFSHALIDLIKGRTTMEEIEKYNEEVDKFYQSINKENTDQLTTKLIKNAETGDVTYMVCKAENTVDVPQQDSVPMIPLIPASPNPVKKNITYLDTIIYQYMTNQMLDIDKDKLIQFALQVDNYTYMTLPLVMYILMKYYDSYFVKEEL